MNSYLRIENNKDEYLEIRHKECEGIGLTADSSPRHYSWVLSFRCKRSKGMNPKEVPRTFLLEYKRQVALPSFFCVLVSIKPPVLFSDSVW